MGRTSISKENPNTFRDREDDLPSKKECAQIQEALLSWYRQSHRDLPWRRSQDPYAIWISEIMLQQTRVETVKEYYRKFMQRFPTPVDLAEAPLDDVLSHWSGLGYYARARNLHAAACEIAQTHGGKFPNTAEEVHNLPGIGPYTAGAILSIAFGRKQPLVDGNVIRVFSRLFAYAENIESASARKHYWNLAEKLVPPPNVADPQKNDPGDFNQALMELGATVCLPQNPMCMLCPLQQICVAKKQGNPEQYPPKKKERAIPTIHAVTLLVEHDNEYLMAQRPASGLWGGLFEPPTFENLQRENNVEFLRKQMQSHLSFDISSYINKLQPLPVFPHTLTHRHMEFSPYVLKAIRQKPQMHILGKYQGLRWVQKSQFSAVGLAAWVTKLLKKR